MGDAISKTYNGRCWIYDYTESILENGETVLIENLLFDEVPCALSNINTRFIQSKVLTDDIVGLNQRILAKLFLSPELDVKAGSKILVLQDNMRSYFTYSGKSFKYSSHQEIMLESFDYI